MNSKAPALIRFVILLSLPFAAPTQTFAAEPAWWTQMKVDCRRSGGSNSLDQTYNDWVASGGCKCAGSATGSGQPTCPDASSSSGGPVLYTGVGLTPQQTLILNGAALLGQALGAQLGKALFGDPEEAARKAQEASRIQMLQQRAVAENARQADLARQRILSMLKVTGESSNFSIKTDEPPSLAIKTGEPPSLTIKTDDSSPLAVKTEDLGPLTIKPDDSGGERTASTTPLIKLADSANVVNSGASVEAAQGFDAAGPIMGAVLPEAPPTPASAPSRSDLRKALQAKVDQSARNQKFLDDLQATIKSSPNPDPLLVSKLQEKIDANTQNLTQLNQQLKATEQATVVVDVNEELGKKQSP